MIMGDNGWADIFIINLSPEIAHLISFGKFYIIEIHGKDNIIANSDAKMHFKNERIPCINLLGKYHMLQHHGKYCLVYITQKCIE